ncbi:Integrator complex subunit 7 [Rhynchospora pubera]|uniref:Integrator complex subunit 7 n=1 Tax=Rhynchospora pubera TaxID=906938 RepID=A0AAV8ASA3_9POAL|nr:Integrator complex subunit 7 [Rhynchospora pubera]KAJ4748774.1 Integrator complex subunit 7 [Rhynchospora pubera]
MEKIPAACAMDWSIELDKALRSKHTDLHNMALQKIGPRLQQLSLESNITKSIADIYDLVPGEDRTFINTIILRLCNIFENGDNQTRSLVLKVFLLELKQLEEKGKGYKGILSKERLSNPEEILKKLKSVFLAGGFEEKALALRMFGCMSDVAKDNFEIRNLVISSLDSSDDREIMAALIACSCFSLLSEDFAWIFLRLLPNIITSLRASAAVVLTAVHALSKIRCTFGVATGAYEVGKAFVMDLLEEDLKPEILSSLTKLASKFCILSLQLVKLLLEVLRQESSPPMKERSVKCLYFLFSRDASHLTAGIDDLAVLVRVTEDVDLPLRYQCGALRIIRKLIHNSIANGTCIEKSDLLKLMQVLESISHSPEKEKQMLSLQILVDIACKYQNKIASGNKSELAMFDDRVNTILFDQIMSLAKMLSDASEELTEKDCTVFKTLLGFSLQIAKDNPSAGLFAFEKSLSLIEVLNKSSTNTGRNLLSCIFRLLNISLSRILENRGVNLDLYPKLRTMVEIIQHNSYERFCLHINVCKTNHGNSFEPANHKLRICTEIKALRLVKKIIEKGNYWDAYKIGIYSLCEGLWFCSAFVFKKLFGVLKSNVHNSWCQFLLLFSASETEIRLLYFPKPCLLLVQELNKEVDFSADDFVCCEAMDNDDENINFNVDLHSFEGKLSRVCDMLQSAEQILMPNVVFYFQRWFVSLRKRFLETVIELMRAINKSEIGNGNLKDFLLDLFSCTLKLTQLAKEYDLISISFPKADSKSLRTISSLALICSLLAFCTGIFIAFLNQMDGIHFSIIPFIEDLYGRLHALGIEAAPYLRQLLPPDSEVMGFLGLFQPRKDKGHFGTFHSDCRSLYEFALSGINRLRDSFAKESVKEAGSLTSLKKGVEFLSEVLLNCIGLNLRIPKYFFKIRPSNGAVLFMFDSGLQNNEISILPGSHLSLNLCIQLKNVADDILSNIKEVHCIISATPSKTCSSESTINFNPSITQEMVELNNRLLQYAKNVSRGFESVNTDEDDDGLVKSCVSFAINGRGQGFGSCLLDVSKFAEGLYQIKWHSCFVDEKGLYWSLLPLNAGVVFSIKED